MAADTVWTRTHLSGQNSLPARVRCSGTDVFVAGSSTQTSTMTGFLLKYTAAGDLEWALDINQHGYDLATALAVGPDRNPVVGLDVGLAAARALLLKVSSTGDTLWSRFWDRCAIKALAVDADNNVYIAGTKGASIQDSVWVAKLSGDGSQVWSRAYRFAGAHTVNGAGVSAAGELYVPLMLIESSEWPELAKFSGTGDTLWRKRFSGVTRFFGIDVQPDGTSMLLANSTLRKLRADGSQIWSTSASSGTMAQDVACDASGNGYVAFTDNSQDFKVRKYGTTGGGVVWTMQCRVPSQDIPLSVAVDVNGQASVTGMGIASVMKALTARFTSSPGISEEGGQRLRFDGLRVTGSVGTGQLLRGSVATPGAYRFSILDAAGRLRHVEPSRRLDAGWFALELPRLPSGVYSIIAYGSEGLSSGRFVVQR